MTWLSILCGLAAFVTSFVVFRADRRRQNQRSTLIGDADHLAKMTLARAEIRRLNAMAEQDRKALRELERHPVSSIEGYRAAVKQSMEDPRTKDDRCSRREPHPAHLWRHVRNLARPDVDESMRRCHGSPDPTHDRHQAFSDEAWRP